MSAASRPARLHHVGLVVTDLEAAVGWYAEACRARVAWREPTTDVDPAALCLPGAPHVRLRGAGLALEGGAYLELHEFAAPAQQPGARLRRVCDPGYGHVALAVEADAIEAERQRFEDLGVRWAGPVLTIASGVLAGQRWLYGKDPWGNVLELIAPAEVAR